MDETEEAVDEFIARNNEAKQEDRRRRPAKSIVEDYCLPDTVKQSNLTKYPDAQLEGRVTYYERLSTFERSGRLAAEYRNEAERTRSEINRRKMYQRAEAERVFEL